MGHVLHVQTEVLPSIPLVPRPSPMPRVVKDGVSLAIRRQLAGRHQVSTKSSTPSTTANMMWLLHTQLLEDPDDEVPLLHQTLIMLQSAGCTGDEGTLV